MPGWSSQVVDQGAALRPLRRELAQDGEAGRVCPLRRGGNHGRVGVPSRRMDNRGLHASLVHRRQHLLLADDRHGAMVHAGSAAGPDIHLGINDAHGL